MTFLSRLSRPNRESIRGTAMIVAAVVLLELFALAAWWSYSQSRLGRIELISERALLSVEVLDESGEVPIGEPIDVIKKVTLTLPDGEYRLRVNGEGRLGRTYRVAVNRGERSEQKLSLDEGRLLGGDPDPNQYSKRDDPREEPMPFAMVTRALELTPGKADIVEYAGQTVIRRDGVTGRAVWDAADVRSSYPPGRDPGPWLRRIGVNRVVVSLVEPAVDLDGDGTRDVILVVDGPNAIIALSGKDGSMIWNHVADLDGNGGPRPEGPEFADPDRPTIRQRQIVGQVSAHDIDSDGTPDLIATMAFWESPAEVARRVGKPVSPRTVTLSRRVVQTISGRTGRLLWDFPVDPAFTTINVRYRDKPATLIPSRLSSTLAIVDGSRWIALEPTTGRTKGNPIDLGFEPVRPLQYADLDGDGEPEIVALGPGSSPKQQSLEAFSIATGKPLWTAAVAAAYPPQSIPGFPTEWPWLIDVDGDGRTEVIVPDSGPMPPTDGYRGMQMIDGISGRTRWVRPMRPETKAEDGLNRIIDAPDLDGDGVRDLIAISKFEGRNPPATNTKKRSEPERAYADALSGRDGRLLWSWHADLAEGKFTHIWAPRWWGLGPDGRPMLAISLGGKDPTNPGSSDWFHPPTVHVLEASTGREQHRILGMNRIHVADLDGDGLMDLWGDADGQLRAFRGELPEIWRTLDRFTPAWKADSISGVTGNRPAVDLDGDGIGDTLAARLSLSGASTGEPKGSRTAIARSGRDGHLLWKTTLDPPRFPLDRDPARSYETSAFPLPGGDLDGDGTPDVVVQKNVQDQTVIDRTPASLPIRALSGRDGRLLWSAGPLPLPFEAHGDSSIAWFAPHAIEPNAPPDLLVRHRSPFLSASSTTTTRSPWAPTQDRLARVSGRTGHILWDIAVEEQPSGQQPGWPVPPKVADLDGDGSLEAVLITRRASAGTQTEFELKVISLRDGAGIWSRAIEYQGFISEPPGFEIGNAQKGHPATVYVTESSGTQNSNELIVHALEGRDGTVRWTWRSGVGPGANKVYGGIDPIDLDGNGKDSICVTYSNLRRECGILILDAQGQQRARRDIAPERVPTSYFPPVSDLMLDLDGDGRDELLVWHDNRLSAWGRNMKELWSIPSTTWPNSWFPRTSPGRRCTLLLAPMTAIDGTSGQVRWMDKTANRGGGYVLDRGDSARLPLLLTGWRSPTVCRQALPVTTRGEYVLPAGASVPSGLVVDDPRWTRPLPWLEPIRRFDVARYTLGAIGLALVNVVVPIGILRLAAGRRPWRVRTLMVLPVVVAIPFWVFQTFELLLPLKIGTMQVSARLVFIGGTLAGIPIVVLVGLAGWWLVRLRGKPLVGIAGLTTVASAIIAAVLIRYDSRGMPAIEHYGRSGWPLVILLGAYAVGILILIGGMLSKPYRWLTRPRRPEPEA